MRCESINIILCEYVNFNRENFISEFLSNKLVLFFRKIFSKHHWQISTKTQLEIGRKKNTAPNEIEIGEASIEKYIGDFSGSFNDLKREFGKKSFSKDLLIGYTFFITSNPLDYGDENDGLSYIKFEERKFRRKFESLYLISTYELNGFSEEKLIRYIKIFVAKSIFLEKLSKVKYLKNFKSEDLNISNLFAHRDQEENLKCCLNFKKENKDLKNQLEQLNICEFCKQDTGMLKDLLKEELNEAEKLGDKEKKNELNQIIEQLDDLIEERNKFVCDLRYPDFSSVVSETIFKNPLANLVVGGLLFGTLIDLLEEMLKSLNFKILVSFPFVIFFFFFSMIFLYLAIKNYYIKQNFINSLVKEPKFDAEKRLERIIRVAMNILRIKSELEKENPDKSLILELSNFEKEIPIQEIKNKSFSEIRGALCQKEGNLANIVPGTVRRQCKKAITHNEFYEKKLIRTELPINNLMYYSKIQVF